MTQTSSIRKRRSGVRGRRDDGATTKAQLLEAAGMVFAEKGFDRATAKEIAERAGANAASVNYYYGGIEGLYEEVLVTAHHRIVSYQALAAVMAGDADPRQKLRGLIELIIRTVTGPASSSWAVRVLTREVLAPSPYINALRQKEIEPKKLLVFGLVSELLGLPREHPIVARACVSIAAPCIMLLVADRHLVAQLFPALGADAANAQALADHMVQFALGGLAALAHPDAARMLVSGGNDHRKI
ncbi:TetR/AcrR family transcriptional regulator [Microvirga mediterraneensis]|uniref:CerR family C-terminal domain-containing protein n=1 Tax=Microvirga mediterraneensis TaxID=2754695 RepID=A0A838BJL7_9HYPH|nr:CerR family C-terminal domain-containing protein [Microvirga mediterraneensis]MBA1155804.1 CerR family C-terminal domain-containing protein [Microvirga mediterraneensis]